MTTTLSKLATGRMRIVRIMAIEGIDHLFAECSQADVQQAWAGTDWDGKDVFTGCFFDLQNEQQADPWQPLQSGGRATLTCADDEFGVMTHRKGAGAITELTESIDRTETTLTVKDTSLFASSGELHIGTECLAYTTTNGTTFTATQRGLYSPFGTTTDEHFSHDHRVGVLANAPNLNPRVTEFPRAWIGRHVGIWLHTFGPDGINSKADALCVFAGRIAEVRDDPATIGTVVVCEHALTSLKESSIGRDLFEGRAADGVYISASSAAGPTQFTFRDWADHSDVSTIKDADPLVVVASGASGTNEMDEGYYTLQELFDVLNAWWAGEKFAGRLNGIYTIGIATIPGEEYRTKLYWSIPGTNGDEVTWGIQMQTVIAKFLGWADSGSAQTIGYTGIGPDDQASGSATFFANTSYHFFRSWIPLRSWLSGGLSSLRVHVEGVSGAFQEQYDSLPGAIKPQPISGYDYGVFLFNEQILMVAALIDEGDGTYSLRDIQPLSLYLIPSQWNTDLAAIRDAAKRYDDPTEIKVRQVLCFGADASTVLAWLLYSTGTSGWNHATYDVLPFGCGIGMPGALLGTVFDTSVANIPGGDKPLVVFLEKTTKLGSVIASDLILRRAFPVWKQGGIRFATWQTPSLALSIATLSEDNKAEPVTTTKPDHRTATLTSDRWAKTIFKIRHTRDLISQSGTASAGSGDSWLGTINIEDRTAVDDGGERGEPLTIDARNSYSEFVGTGSGIEDLVTGTFIPTIRMFSEPVTTMRRSVSPMEWEAIVPGDVVTLSDRFARDPDTGRRVIGAQPATVTRATYNMGGLRPGADKPDQIVAEVELMLGESSRYYAYAPSALVTSYNSGTKTLTVDTHSYTEFTEADEDVDYFSIGDAIRITEIDPSDPSTALTWTRTITGISGSTITHDGVALASFDSGKEYRVTFDTYSACQSSQLENAFQADDADNLIENIAQADRFGLSMSTIATVADTHITLGELYANADIGDGKAYDVGSIKGICRLVDSMIDHRTSVCSPVLGPIMENADYSSGDTWKVLSISPLFLSTGLASASVSRWLSLAPRFRSSDGTATSIRVTIAKAPPQTNTLNDIGYQPNSASAIWSTSSTTWQVPDPVEALTSFKPASGIVWLIIEGKYKCQTMGLARCIEQERQ